MKQITSDSPVIMVKEKLLNAVLGDNGLATPNNKIMNINIKEVSNSRELDSIYRLTYKTFRERRICAPKIDSKLSNNIALDFNPETKIFIATLNDEMIGTLSYTICHTAQDLYNYSTFSDELCNEVLPNGKAFSSWRMATKPGFGIQPLVLMMLMRKVIEVNLLEDTTRGYFSVVSDDTQVYQKILHRTELLATKRKKTREIDGDLSYFRIDIDQSHVDMLTRRIDIMASRWSNRYQKAG